VNLSTLITTVQAALVAQTWSGGGVVFPSGSVQVTANTETAMDFALKNFRSPMCLIQPLDGECDPKFDEEPDLIYENFEIRLIVNIPGDPVGANALMGANLTNGAAASEGQGLLSLEQQLFNAIGFLNAANGLTIQFRGKGQLTAGHLENRTYLAYRAYRFQAMCTWV
jgi:hypothetical protein